MGGAARAGTLVSVHIYPIGPVAGIVVGIKATA